jgi:transposase
VVSDLLGASGRRILTVLSEGEADPVKLAQLGDDRLKCSREELADALRGTPTPTHLAVLKLFLERLKLLDTQIQALDQLVAQEMKQHQEAVVRLTEIPGFGVDSAQQIIAEVGVDAETFPSAGNFCSWVGVCPGSNISAEENNSSRSPKGNLFVRKILTQAAQARCERRSAICSRFSAASCPNSATTGRSGRSPIGSPA